MSFSLAPPSFFSNICPSCGDVHEIPRKLYRQGLSFCRLSQKNDRDAVSWWAVTVEYKRRADVKL